MKYSLIITAWKEPDSVEQNIANILNPTTGNLLSDMEIILVCPDEETKLAAIHSVQKFNFQKFHYIKDDAVGKPAALNKAFDAADGEILICTDGDVILGANSLPQLIKNFDDKHVGGISGRPVSADSKKTILGYWGNLLADAAHKKRMKEFVSKRNYFMSGYLCAFRKLDSMKIPEKTLVDDAWITLFLVSKGYKIDYAPNAIVLVKYPQTFSDWIKQKRRTAGGYEQLKTLGALNAKIKRNFIEELKFAFFPISYSRNVKEFVFALMLYPARLVLWLLVFFDKITGKQEGINLWVRIETTK